MDYDSENIFAKIIRGEIPNQTVFEDEHVLAFNDISPQTPVHVLVIPKGSYVNLVDFSEQASDAEIVAYVRALGQVAKSAGVGESGFRTIANNGEDAIQEVQHLHTHVIGGRRLGRMLKPLDK